jgi:tRNA uridine 5-carbamoylmethylation protein Kti12
MFEEITRMKARFDSPQGQLTVEDLWDIPLTAHKNKANLDDIARELSRQVRESETESFVIKPPLKNAAAVVKLETVKHIIKVRLDEQEAAALIRANHEKKQRIMEIIAHKEDESLANQSIDDLRKMVESL